MSPSLYNAGSATAAMSLSIAWLIFRIVFALSGVHVPGALLLLRTASKAATEPAGAISPLGNSNPTVFANSSSFCAPFKNPKVPSFSAVANC